MPRLLELEQLAGADRLDLGHDEVGRVAPHATGERRAVEHVDHLVSVRHLHRGSVGVAVHGDHAAAEALGADHELLAELARAEQEDLRGSGDGCPLGPSGLR